MRCIRCHSPKIIKFIDGFGEPRVFCRDCNNSVLIKDILMANQLIQIPKPTETRRFLNEGVRTIGSFINSG
ncbi:MAG: hypothetical protein QXY45_03195 [Candidatus Aenigmatarchaeota archaeon]